MINTNYINYDNSISSPTFKIYPLGPEFYSGQDTHEWTNGLSNILGFAMALRSFVKQKCSFRKISKIYFITILSSSQK